MHRLLIATTNPGKLKEIEPGYPFRSLLFLPQFGKLYKDLTLEEHAQANHRLKALTKLKPFIQKRLGRVA